jgi:hypothetical protein
MAASCVMSCGTRGKRDACVRACLPAMIHATFQARQSVAGSSLPASLLSKVGTPISVLGSEAHSSSSPPPLRTDAESAARHIRKVLEPETRKHGITRNPKPEPVETQLQGQGRRKC